MITKQRQWDSIRSDDLAVDDARRSRAARSRTRPYASVTTYNMFLLRRDQPGPPIVHAHESAEPVEFGLEDVVRAVERRVQRAEGHGTITGSE